MTKKQILENKIRNIIRKELKSINEGAYSKLADKLGMSEIKDGADAKEALELIGYIENGLINYFRSKAKENDEYKLALKQVVGMGLRKSVATTKSKMDNLFGKGSDYEY